MGSGALSVSLLGCALIACGAVANGGEPQSTTTGGSSSASGGSTATGGATGCDAVQFDPAVEVAVRSDLQKPRGELPATELATARSVRITGASSLAGLECLTHLQYFASDGGSFEDLSPLSGLGDLKVITVIGSEVRSLAPLVGLPALETVGFTHGRVSDLAPLAEIPTLTWVSVYGEVTDLSPLAKLPHLQKLELYGNALRDVSSLGVAPELTYLSLDGTLIESIDIDAPVLRELFVEDTPLRELSSLARFPLLETFRAARSPIDDITVLGDLPRLRDVELQNTNVHDLSPLLRTPLTDTNCPPLTATDTPLDEPLAAEVVPQLCANGWSTWLSRSPHTCRPECIHGLPR